MRLFGSLVLVAALATLAALVVASVRGGSTARSPRAAPADGQPLRLARAPYMGVACGIPNSIACDRVGLAVWLHHPAERVSASIAGRRFVLGHRFPVSASRPQMWMFSGFLEPAGMLEPGPLRVTLDRKPDYWAGAHPVAARVRISVLRPGGSREAATLRVPLHAGWG